MEYCELGSLHIGLRRNFFLMPPDTRPSMAGIGQQAASAAASSASPPAAQAAGAPGARVNMRSLLLTLIEIASACSYLHRMGVVHCDLRPANVLLKSSRIDCRGFQAKVADFGLSRWGVTLPGDQGGR